MPEKVDGISKGGWRLGEFFGERYISRCNIPAMFNMRSSCFSLKFVAKASLD